jgi:hypothetical protein
MAPECMEVYLESGFFLVLAGEFESIETSPGFARFLGENGRFQSLKKNC